MQPTIIKDAVKLFGEHCLLSRSTATARAYRNSMNSFTEFLSSEGLTKDDLTSLLQAQHFISFPAYLLKAGYAKMTIGVYVSGAKYFYEWLVINDMVEPPDYAKSLRFEMASRDAMKRRSSKMVRFPKNGEADLMVNAVKELPYETPIKERNIAIVLFLRSSGCRNAEIVGLVIDDLDMKEHSAIVTGKGSKQRRIYFDDATAQALQEYWRARGWSSPSDPVFARHDRGAGKKRLPMTTTTTRNVITEVCATAGIEKGKFTPHYFRHSFAITMLRETGNLALVQDLLGHAEPTSTRVYAKIYPDDLRDAHHKVYK